MKRIWKKIKETNGKYSVSNDGLVKNTKTNKILKTFIGSSGYSTTNFFINNKIMHRSVHRLVAIAFISNKQNKRNVNHIDCDKLNNNVNNLEWVTDQENIDHAWKNGLMKPRPGIKNHNAKLTENDIFKIRKMKHQGFHRKVIAEKFNIQPGHVNKIVSGERWKHLIKKEQNEV